ncbi:hypothetical protein AB205_0109200 [Aquarana catesbeiana]|uniref:Uncharacterized protein n=1 Tax=Aquarana catesbeiana TaxID=8400 RepID=A0A2G9P5S3_AQUCT|nr:hypothetical protein AB205_0109200 [Aquarana catesbeiana]
MFFLVYSPPLLVRRSGEEHMWRQSRCVLITAMRRRRRKAQSQKRRRRQFKASNMSFVEIVEMVDILKRADYDRKYGPYPNPNVR